MSVKLLVWCTVKVGDNKTYIELTLTNSVVGLFYYLLILRELFIANSTLSEIECQE